MSESGITAKLSYYSPCNEEAYALDLANATEFLQINERMLAYYRSSFTQELLFRTRALKRLRSWLKSHEAELLDALRADLNIATREAYLSELVPVTRGLSISLANLKSWTKPKRATKLPLPFTTKVEIHQSPLGLVTIVGSPTRPFQDCLNPLVQAVSAGNCVILCPHEENPNTARVLRKLCRECFDSRFIFCLPADKAAKDLALKSKASKIFFYGSENEGAAALHAAADSLSPVSLTLDAACPFIIDTDTDLKRLSHAFSQKAVLGSNGAYNTPSHFFVHESRLEEFLNRFDSKLPKTSILKWQEEDRYHLAGKTQELGRIHVCYLFSNDEELQKRLAKQLNCELLLINDYPSLISEEHRIIPGRHKNNANSIQAKIGFEGFSQSKISLKKPNLLELPLRIAKSAKVPTPCTLAPRKAETEQK